MDGGDVAGRLDVQGHEDEQDRDEAADGDREREGEVAEHGRYPAWKLARTTSSSPSLLISVTVTLSARMPS